MTDHNGRERIKAELETFRAASERIGAEVGDAPQYIRRAAQIAVERERSANARRHGHIGNVSRKGEAL